MSSVLPGVAWKVLTAPQMGVLLSEARFAGAPVDLADGYIHLSTAEQLAGTIDKHFAGQSELVLAAIDLTMLGDAVRWEASRGGALFPHIYGDLPLAAVIAHSPLTRQADGTLVLPTSPLPLAGGAGGGPPRVNEARAHPFPLPQAGGEATDGSKRHRNIATKRWNR